MEPAAAVSDNYDLIVLGSGAAGLAAAATAASHGFRVLVAEKDRHFGGASAISGGTIWIPGTAQAIEAQLDSSLETARKFLMKLAGDGAHTHLIDAFLARGAEALAYLEQNTELEFRVRPVSPDYHMEIDGASEGGRALEIVEYDGSWLGARFAELRKPPEGMLLFGGMMVNRVDIQHFLNMRRSFTSLARCTRLILGYLKDRISHSRGTRLIVGNALIARLARSVIDLGVDLRTNVSTHRLIVDDGVVRGIVIASENGEREIRARAGVVLATGGFGASGDAGKWRPATSNDHRSMSPQANVGEGLRFAAQAGAAMGEGLVSNFYWAPISVMRKPDGTEEKFPHLVTDRAKPGLIAVNKEGRRFVNEADSYHRFVMAMQSDPQRNSPCYLICDAKALAAYGMGLARPAPGSNTALVRNGYLIKANTIEELARHIGVPADALADTVTRYNSAAETGVDGEFGKGSSSYNRSMGDAGHRPNPCLAPVAQAPFYAVKLMTGDLGSARGICTDSAARAIDLEGRPISGLYAAGNDMNSIMNGTYPGPGITLGPALTFGYIAAKDAVARLQDQVQEG